MAQAFTRLGALVTVLERESGILHVRDPELAALLAKRLESEGVRLCTAAQVSSLDQQGSLQLVHYARAKGRQETITSDALLVAAGRRPRTAGLNLESAGVRYTAAGVPVDRRCRTNVQHIYAIGDVTGRYAYTHMSEHMARVAATNALLRLPRRIDAWTVPGVVFTDPEFAHVGACESELKRRGTRYEVYALGFI